MRRLLPLLLAGMLPVAVIFLLRADHGQNAIAEVPDQGMVVGEDCYAHHQEGATWPQFVGNQEGVVTCHNNSYYFEAVRTVQASPPRGLGRVVGTGCLARHAEGESWPEVVAGMEGLVSCSQDQFHFWPVRYSPPMKNPLLDRSTLLCYYGNRAASSMGILGEHSLEELEKRLQELAAIYDELNGDLGVTLCLDYVYLVANRSSHPYAHYTPRYELFEEALQFAAERDMAFFVDLQLGYRDVEQEVREVLPLMLAPNVHLALDTEFYMAHTGGIPGERLGNMAAEDVNRAVLLVQAFVEEHRLPDKIVKVYQFDSSMLTNKHLLDSSAPKVSVLINADGVGFGGVAGKLRDYAQYAGERYDALGIKLFRGWDSPLLQPDEVMALEPQPNEIVYQ